MSPTGQAATRANNEPITIGDEVVEPGERKSIELPFADLYTHTGLTLPVHVINSRHAGPTLFVTAALHGDELNGVNIIRRLLALPELKRLRGRLLAVPIVNVFGFIARTRYLPDRRDLNRSFPGSEKGSIASRLAHLVVKEIIAQADYGIDLHTAAVNRENLPHIRGYLADPKVLALAKRFGAPVILDSSIPEGSLRQYAAQQDIPILCYEAGEALRFDEVSIRAGVSGIRRVMRALGMLPPRTGKSDRVEPMISQSTTWIRAPRSGIVEIRCRLGTRVQAGQVLAVIGDPFGATQSDVVATTTGIVIGRNNLPLAHEGDALFHIARFDSATAAQATVEEFQQSQAGRDDWP